MNDIKIYPDTAAGARAFMLDEGFDCSEAIATADPWVRGVWDLDLSECPIEDDGELVTSFIVYLAGYPDPWGNMRQENDFEDFVGFGNEDGCGDGYNF
jgi:hypothetical protein